MAVSANTFICQGFRKSSSPSWCNCADLREKSQFLYKDGAIYKFFSHFLWRSPTTCLACSIRGPNPFFGPEKLQTAEPAQISEGTPSEWEPAAHPGLLPVALALHLTGIGCEGVGFEVHVSISNSPEFLDPRKGVISTSSPQVDLSLSIQRMDGSELTSAQELRAAPLAGAGRVSCESLWPTGGEVCCGAWVFENHFLKD